MANKEMKTLTFGNVTYEIVDEKARQELSAKGKPNYESEGENSFATNETNIGLGDYSFAEGYNTISGGKGFKVLSRTGKIGGSGSYTLDSIVGLEIGDQYSIRLQNNYDYRGIIKSISTDTNIITVTNYIDESVNYGREVTLWIPEKLTIGTTKLGQCSHAEGYETRALCYGSHAEGYYTTASGDQSHAEGYKTIAGGKNSHAEGQDTKASGDNSHAEGQDTTASAEYSHAEGYKTKASGDNSHAEGLRCSASGSASHAEGANTKASGDNSHAEGCGTTASGYISHVEGYYTYTTASAEYSHAEGYKTTAGGNNSHAEGNGTTTGGKNSHAEGYKTTASGEQSHAEGNGTTAEGNNSHAEGTGTTAFANQSHAEGLKTFADGDQSHAEGLRCTASGSASHAEGADTIAFASRSHAEGVGTEAYGYASHVQGKYNVVDNGSTDYPYGQYAHIVGNGTNDTNRSNAHTLDWQGNAWFQGVIQAPGSDYAEYFEWLDGNPNSEDRIGLLVTLDGEKIKPANIGDDILGIISGTAAVLGDNYECEWNGKYLTDDFGRVIYDLVEEFIDVEHIEFKKVEKEIIDEETNEVRIEIELEEVKTVEKQSLGFWKHPRINPDYDPEQKYINRTDRPEWDTVGMLGKLHVRDDGTCQVNGYATVGDNGIATKSDEKTNMRVLSRVNEHVVRVLLK